MLLRGVVFLLVLSLSLVITERPVGGARLEGHQHLFAPLGDRGLNRLAICRLSEFTVEHALAAPHVWTGNCVTGDGYHIGHIGDLDHVVWWWVSGGVVFIGETGSRYHAEWRVAIKEERGAPIVAEIVEFGPRIAEPEVDDDPR